MLTRMIHLIDYSNNNIEELDLQEMKECIPYRKKKSVTWIDINNLEDTAVIDTVGVLFDIHPLIIEGIKHPGQRPKMEELDSYSYFVLRMFSFLNDKITTEQVSIIMGDTYLITFQERPGDIFNPVRERIRARKYRINSYGPDFLAYSLIDAIVDNYYIILETLGEQISLQFLYH